MREHHLTVQRTARYFALGPGEGARDIWFVCHGYGQLARYFLRHFATLDNGSRLIIAPEALSRFYVEDPGGRHGDARVGATWMTREDRETEMRDYVAYLDALYAHVTAGATAHPRVTALGFSQGVATVARWVAAGRSAVQRLVLWAEYLPPDLDLVAAAPTLRTLSLTFVAGDQDSAITPERNAADETRLRDAGIPYRIVRFPGGHELHGETLRTLGAE